MVSFHSAFPEGVRRAFDALDALDAPERLNKVAGQVLSVASESSDLEVARKLTSAASDMASAVKDLDDFVRASISTRSRP